MYRNGTPVLWAELHLPSAATLKALALNRLGSDPARLLDKCKRGDQRAWEELVSSYQRLVYSVPSRMGLNAEDCADVFQATFAALSANLDRINSPQALPKWLAITASREALRLKRISSRSTRESEIEDLSLEQILATEENEAEKTSIAEAEAEMVRQALERLPEKCRKLLSVLFYEEEKPYAQVSERLGMPVGAIGPTRARCLEKLRGLLQEAKFFD